MANKKSTKVVRRQRQVRRSMPHPHGLPQFLIAQIDAFNDDAFGVKVPDESSALSATGFSRSYAALGTGTDGSTAVVIRPNARQAILFPTSSTNQVQGWGPDYGRFGSVSNFSNLVANAELIRTVAYGVKITTRANPQTLAGVVHVAPIPDDLTDTNWTFPTSSAALQGMPGYTRVPIASLCENHLLIPGRWADYSAFKYMDPNYAINATTTQLQSSGWTNVCIFVESLAGVNNIIDVDIVHHWEFQPKLAITAGVIEPTDAADYSPALMGAVKYVVSKLPSVAVRAATITGRIPPQVGALLEAGIQVVNGLAHTGSNVGWKQPRIEAPPARRMIMQ